MKDKFIEPNIKDLENDIFKEYKSGYLLEEDKFGEKTKNKSEPKFEQTVGDSNNDLVKEIKELRKEVSELKEININNSKNDSCKEDDGYSYYVPGLADRYQSKEYLRDKEERMERTGGGRFRESW